MVFGVDGGTTCKWMDGCWWCVNVAVVVVMCTHSDGGYGTGNCLLHTVIIYH